MADRQYWERRARKGPSLSSVAYESAAARVNAYFDILFEKAIFETIAELGLDVDCTDKKILDVGCGFGRWSFRLSRLPAKVIGLDFCSEMIANALNLGSKVEVENADFVVGCAEALPFRDNYFDMVLSVTELQHIFGAERICSSCAEMIRVLKPNGYIVILEETHTTGPVSRTTFARKIAEYECLFGSQVDLVLRKGLDTPLPFGSALIRFKLPKVHSILSNLPPFRNRSQHSILVFKKSMLGVR